MDHFFWFLRVESAFGLFAAVQYSLVVGFALYQIDHAFLLLRHLWLGAIGHRGWPALRREDAPSALLVMPTLLRTHEELAGMKRAIRSVLSNGYPGALVVVASIDDAAHDPAIYGALEAWVASLVRPAGVRVYATCTPRRTGKAVAIARAVSDIEERVARGELGAFPTVFFNMDGDSELGPRALERMVQRLMRPGLVSGERPMIVTSNVCIARGTYWKGWRDYASVRGQLAILVAREYLTSIAIGKFNGRLTPMLEASGALYCTWSSLHVQAPRWAAFMQTLTLRAWVRWWLGAAPPSFANSGVAALPEAQTGPGDDTWMTWLASCARWEDGAISLELPRTPMHAFAEMVRGYVFRPVTFEPSARIVTKTPTTVRALFRQRIRWNSSRVQDLQRWSPAFAYHWRTGWNVALSTAFLLYVHALIVCSLLLWPFAAGHAAGRGVFMAIAIAYALNTVVRGASTAFALLIDGGVRRDWRLLLALPLTVPYHFVFNILPTIVGCFADIFLFGVNTNFSPEETYIKSGLSRVALAYRLRRAFALAIRCALFGDVPLGAFWLGWHATDWTPNGFEGWTGGERRVLLPRPRPGARP